MSCVRPFDTNVSLKHTSAFVHCFVVSVTFRTRLRRWPCSSSSRPACRRRRAPPPSTAITSSQPRAEPRLTWRRPRLPTRRYGVSVSQVCDGRRSHPVAWAVSLSLSLQCYQSVSLFAYVLSFGLAGFHSMYRSLPSASKARVTVESIGNLCTCASVSRVLRLLWPAPAGNACGACMARTVEIRRRIKTTTKLSS